MPVTAALPEGVLLRPLTMHSDERGCFTEIFRNEWPTGMHPVQWNLVTSEPGVLRGVHVHVHHDDYLAVAQGTVVVGLHDMRPDSPTFGLGTTVSLNGDSLAGLVIPHGVAHGFFFPGPALYVYAVSVYWDQADELGCQWADPDLGIVWPVQQATLSERDAGADSFADLSSTFVPLWQQAHGTHG